MIPSEAPFDAVHLQVLSGDVVEHSMEASLHSSEERLDGVCADVPNCVDLLLVSHYSVTTFEMPANAIVR